MTNTGKKPIKNELIDTPAIDMKCVCSSSGSLTRQPTMIGEQLQPLSKKSSTKTQIYHDLKRIAIAINELCRDLDRLEREELNEQPDR